jgi:UDP-glucose 4-epimerase
MAMKAINNHTQNTPRRYLITGGCGFLGTSLIRHLLGNNLADTIRVLDNLSVGTRQDLGSVCSFVDLDPKDLNRRTVKTKAGVEQVELITGDICDPVVTRVAGKEIDIIVHLAANTGVAPSVRNPENDMQCNVVGTFNLLEASRINEVKHFIFASSGAPIGERLPPIHEEIAPKPVSPYGASKLAGEGYCSAYYHTFGIRTVSLRFGNVYGPGSRNKDSVIARFIKRAIAGEILEIYGDGNQTRDFIYIEDILDAILSASCSNIGGEIFQIATHRETSVNELVAELRNVFEYMAPDIEIRTGKKPHRKGDVRRNYSDTSKAKKLLDWSSRWPLQKGLAATVEWFIINESSMK